MSARYTAGAVRTDVNLPGVAGHLHLFDELQERAGRRIFLFVMMNLPGVGPVIGLRTEELGRFVNQLEKHVDSDRIIRRPENGARVLLARRAAFTALGRLLFNLDESLVKR